MSNHTKRYKQGYRRKSANRLPQLLVLWALLICAVQGKAFTQLVPGLGLSAGQLKPVQKADNLSRVAAIFPFESVPSGLEIELLEEAALEDEPDEYWTLTDFTVFSDEAFYNAVVRSRLLHYHAALHNRQQVPYFILYHSWKSYLA